MNNINTLEVIDTQYEMLKSQYNSGNNSGDIVKDETMLRLEKELDGVFITPHILRKSNGDIVDVSKLIFRLVMLLKGHGNEDKVSLA